LDGIDPRTVVRCGLLLQINYQRSTVGGRAFPVAGAMVWNGLQAMLRRRCRCDRLITFPFPTHYLPPQNSGPCNSFYCLGHFKNVCDDDDDDDTIRYEMLF